MIHRERDNRKIEVLKDVLRKFVSLPGGRRLTFSLDEIGVPYIANKFVYFEKSLCHSHYKFIYIGDDFDSERDFQHQLQQHYALNEMIRKQDASVVPMTDSPQTNIPMLLDIFKRLDIWKLLRQRSLDAIYDVEALGSGDVDESIIDFISHLFEPTALTTASWSFSSYVWLY